MPASTFKVDFADASVKLDLCGVVTIVNQELVELVTPEVAAAGAEYGLLMGSAIFLRPETTASGALRRDALDGERIVMTNGEGGQRLQAPLQRPNKPRELPASASIAEHADYEQQMVN